MTIPTKPHLQVTAAVIVYRNRVLIARRGPRERHPGRWEFPGGKQEPGETLTDCLIREIREELALDVEATDFITAVDHEYEAFSLTLHAYRCRLAPGAGDPADGRDRALVSPDRLDRYDLLPPDRAIARAILESGPAFFKGD